MKIWFGFLVSVIGSYAVASEVKEDLKTEAVDELTSLPLTAQPPRQDFCDDNLQLLQVGAHKFFTTPRKHEGALLVVQNLLYKKEQIKRALFERYFQLDPYAGYFKENQEEEFPRTTPLKYRIEKKEFRTSLEQMPLEHLEALARCLFGKVALYLHMDKVLSRKPEDLQLALKNQTVDFAQCQVFYHLSQVTRGFTKKYLEQLKFYLNFPVGVYPLEWEYFSAHTLEFSDSPIKGFRVFLKDSSQLKGPQNPVDPDLLSATGWYYIFKEKMLSLYNEELGVLLKKAPEERKISFLFTDWDTWIENAKKRKVFCTHGKGNTQEDILYMYRVAQRVCEKKINELSLSLKQNGKKRSTERLKKQHELNDWKAFRERALMDAAYKGFSQNKTSPQKPPTPSMGNQPVEDILRFLGEKDQKSPSQHTKKVRKTRKKKTNPKGKNSAPLQETSLSNYRTSSSSLVLEEKPSSPENLSERKEEPKVEKIQEEDSKSFEPVKSRSQKRREKKERTREQMPVPKQIQEKEQRTLEMSQESLEPIDLTPRKSQREEGLDKESQPLSSPQAQPEDLEIEKLRQELEAMKKKQEEMLGLLGALKRQQEEEEKEKLKKLEEEKEKLKSEVERRKYSEGVKEVELLIGVKKIEALKRENERLKSSAKFAGNIINTQREAILMQQAYLATQQTSLSDKKDS